jgi:tetratricopeptide (TPR) repeat protein
VSVALWGIHASSTMGIARLVELVRARPQMSDASLTATLDFFGARTLGSGHPEWAASLFERAIAVGGANPRLLYQAGEAYLAAGDAGRARGAFERAAALNPAYTDPWLGLARVALAQGDSLRVAAMLDSAGARVPADAVSRRLARDRWLRELSRDQPSPGAVRSSP